MWQEDTWHQRRWPRPGPVPMSSLQSREETRGHWDGRQVRLHLEACGLYLRDQPCPPRAPLFFHLFLGGPTLQLGLPALHRGYHEDRARLSASTPSHLSRPGPARPGVRGGGSAVRPVSPVRGGSGRGKEDAPHSRFPSSLQAGQRQGLKLQVCEAGGAQASDPPTHWLQLPTAGHTQP